LSERFAIHLPRIGVPDWSELLHRLVTLNIITNSQMVGWLEVWTAMHRMD